MNQKHVCHGHVWHLETSFLLNNFVVLVELNEAWLNTHCGFPFAKTADVSRFLPYAFFRANAAFSRWALLFLGTTIHKGGLSTFLTTKNHPNFNLKQNTNHTISNSKPI